MNGAGVKLICAVAEIRFAMGSFFETINIFLPPPSAFVSQIANLFPRLPAVSGRKEVFAERAAAAKMERGWKLHPPPLLPTTSLYLVGKNPLKNLKYRMSWEISYRRDPPPHAWVFLILLYFW